MINLIANLPLEKERSSISTRIVFTNKKCVFISKEHTYQEHDASRIKIHNQVQGMSLI